MARRASQGVYKEDFGQKGGRELEHYTVVGEDVTGKSFIVWLFILDPSTVGLSIPETDVYLHNCGAQHRNRARPTESTVTLVWEK